MFDYFHQQQKVNPQHKVNTTEEDPLHSQQKKENVVVKNTEQFQQSQSHLPHKEISDKEEKSQNASEDQSDESKSEQQQTAPTRQNPEVRSYSNRFIFLLYLKY